MLTAAPSLSAPSKPADAKSPAVAADMRACVVEMSDFDGCLRYVGIDERAEEHYRQYPNHYPHLAYATARVIVHCNKPNLLNLIVAEAQAAQKEGKQLVFKVGTASQGTDADRNIIGRPCPSFPSYKAIADHFQTELGSKGQGSGDLFYFNTYLSEDGVKKRAAGTSFKLGLDLKQAADASIFIRCETSKIILMYEHIHQFAHERQTQGKNGPILFNFTDNLTGPILNEIHKFYSKYPWALPKNVLLQLRHYEGGKRTNWGPPIQGTGAIDPEYAQSALDMQTICRELYPNDGHRSAGNAPAVFAEYMATRKVLNEVDANLALSLSNTRLQYVKETKLLQLDLKSVVHKKIFVAALAVLKKYLSPSEILQLLAEQPQLLADLIALKDAALLQSVKDVLELFLNSNDKDAKSAATTEDPAGNAAFNTIFTVNMFGSMANTVGVGPLKLMPLIKKMDAAKQLGYLTSLVWNLNNWNGIVAILEKPQLIAVLQKPNYLWNYCGSTTKTADDFLKTIAAVVPSKISSAELLAIIQNCNLLTAVANSNSLAKVIPALAEFLSPRELLQAIAHANVMPAILETNDAAVLKCVYNGLTQPTPVAGDEKVGAPSVSTPSAATSEDEKCFAQLMGSKNKAGRSALGVITLKISDVTPLLERIELPLLKLCLIEVYWFKASWNVIVKRLEAHELVEELSKNNYLWNCYKLNAAVFRDIVAGARTKISSAQLLQIIKAIKFDATNVFTSADLQNLLPLLDQHLEFSDLLQALEHFGVMRAITAKYLAFLNVLKQHLNPNKLLQVLAHQPATPKALASNPDQELQKFIFEALSQFVSTEHKQTEHKDSKDHSPTAFDKLIAAEDANNKTMLVSLTLSPNKHDTLPLIKKMQPQDVYRSVTAVVWALPAWIVIVDKLDKLQLTAVLQHPNYLSNYYGPTKTADDFRKTIAAIFPSKISSAELLAIIQNCNLLTAVAKSNALAKVIPVLAVLLSPRELIQAIAHANVMPAILETNDAEVLQCVYKGLTQPTTQPTPVAGDEKVTAPSGATPSAVTSEDEKCFAQLMGSKNQAGRSALGVITLKISDVTPLLERIELPLLKLCLNEVYWFKASWNVIVKRLEAHELVEALSKNNYLWSVYKYSLATFIDIVTIARTKISSAQLLQAVKTMQFDAKSPPSLDDLQKILPMLATNLELSDFIQAIEFFKAAPKILAAGTHNTEALKVHGLVWSSLMGFAKTHPRDPNGQNAFDNTICALDTRQLSYLTCTIRQSQLSALVPPDIKAAQAAEAQVNAELALTLNAVSPAKKVDAVRPVYVWNTPQFARIASHLTGDQLFDLLNFNNGADLLLIYQYRRERFDAVINIAVSKCTSEQMRQLTAPLILRQYWQKWAVNLFIAAMLITSIAMIAGGVSAVAGFELLFITSALTTHFFGAGVVALLIAGAIKLFNALLNPPINIQASKVGDSAKSDIAPPTPAANLVPEPTLSPAQLAAKFSAVCPEARQESGVASTGSDAPPSFSVPTLSVVKTN